MSRTYVGGKVVIHRRSADGLTPRLVMNCSSKSLPDKQLACCSPSAGDTLSLTLVMLMAEEVSSLDLQKVVNQIGSP